MNKYNSKALYLALITLLGTTGLLVSTAHAENIQGVSLKTDKGSQPLSDYHGNVVYLDFWASWCGPCRKSFPWLNQMQQKYAKSGFKVIAVNLDKDRTAAAQFLKETPASFMIAYDPDGAIAKQLKVVGMPSSYLIDRQGNIVSSHIGFLEKDIPELEEKITNLLNKKR